MPQVLIRFMSIRHSDEIKKSRIIAMIWLVVSLSSAVCIGLIGRAVIPTEFLTQSAAESVFIVLSKMLLPSFFCGLVVSGIFALPATCSSPVPRWPPTSSRASSSAMPPTTRS